MTWARTDTSSRDQTTHRILEDYLETTTQGAQSGTLGMGNLLVVEGQPS